MGKFDKYECEGQISIFDFLAPQEPPKVEYETPEADKLRANGWKNMYDETPPVGFYEVCDINKPNRIWVTECNEDGSWWNPNGLSMSWWRPLTYKSDEVIYREAILHGSGFAGGKKRIIDFFASEYDDKKRIEFLKNEYGVGGWTTDYGCVDHNAGGLDFSYKEKYKQANKYAKLVHSGWPMVAKEIEYLIQRGIYTADVEPVTKHTCKHSEHECNKEELWKVADSLDETQCPHVCCRQCNTRGCGARCNGSKEPEQPNLCQDCIFQWLEIPNEGFGCHYDTNKNICCKEKMYKASEGWHLVKARPPYTVPMELPTNKNWEPVQVLLYNSEYDLYVVGDHWQAKDNTFKSYLPEPFGGVVAWRYKKEKKKNET